MKSAKKKTKPVVSGVPEHTSLRGQVAQMRATHRAELAEMAEQTRLERAAFVQQIHADVTQRIIPAAEQRRAEFRAEHAEMAERTRLDRQQFLSQIRAWVG